MRSLFFFSLILFSVTHCASLAKKVFDTPRVAVEKIELKDVSFAGVTLLVDVSVENPNSVGVTISGLQYKVSVDGSSLAEGSRPEKTAIEGNKKSIFTFPIVIYYSGLKNGVMGVLTQSMLPYEFDGKVTLETPVGNFDFDINNKGDIPIPRRPHFEVENVTVNEMGLTTATITFQVLVTNNEDLALELQQFNYRINIQGEDITASNVQIERNLGLGKNMRLKIPVILNFLSLRQGFIETIKKGKFSYNIQFNLQMNSSYGPYTLPFEKEGLVSLY